MLPTISGTIIMLRRCVLTASGFSIGGASFFARRNFLTSADSLRLRPPREKRLRARECNSSISCSLQFVCRVKKVYQTK